MAFKTFAPGVLTSSDVNTFLMKQAVITCTAATRPASPNEGMTIYETDTDATLQYTGTAWVRVFGLGAWQTWTPTVESLVGTAWQVGNGTITGRYLRQGNIVIWSLRFDIGSTTVRGTSGTNNELEFSNFPFANNGAVHIGGDGYAADVSVGTGHGMLFVQETSTSILPKVYSGTTNLAGVINTVPFTWDTGDFMTFRGYYEV